MKGIIYKYTSPSGKCYIGQTINEDRRKLQHKRAAFNENHKEYDKPFYRALRKYGWDSFEYEVVRIWESGCQAEREAGYDSTKISRVCNHKLPYYGKKNEDKYLWSFSELHDVETKD